MDIKRLLIADPSEVFAEDLICRLAGSFQVKYCSDGYEAQTLLRSFQPHVVVLDLMMRGLDGIALMDSMRQNRIQPKILITTCFMTPFIERIIHRIPFDYLMYKPCDCGILADRIREISADSCRDIIMSGESNSYTADMLRSLSICTNHKGYQYLQYGVELFRTHPDASMTKNLYPAIGQHFGVRSDAVERDIRRAITAAWSNSDSYTWRMFFDCDHNGCIPRPTNAVFISAVAHRLNQSKAI